MAALVCVLAWFMSVCVRCMCVSTSTVRGGYSLNAAPHQGSGNVGYYIERELSQFPSVKMAALKRKPSTDGSVLCLCDARLLPSNLSHVL